MAQRKSAKTKAAAGSKASKHAPTQKKLRKEWDESEVVVPDGKTSVTVRFDSDLVDWFKEQGPKYQTRMNQVLRKFMETQAVGDADVQHERNLNMEFWCTAERNKNEYLFALNRLGDYWLSQNDGAKASEYFSQTVAAYQEALAAENDK